MAKKFLFLLMFMLLLTACDLSHTVPSPEPAQSVAVDNHEAELDDLPTQNNTEQPKIALLLIENTIESDVKNDLSKSAVEEYALVEGHMYEIYTASENTAEACFSVAEKAVSEGADIVVAMGQTFAEAVFVLQNEYSNIQFLLFDGIPEGFETDAEDSEQDESDRTFLTADNTSTINYAYDEAGYLAGFAAVTNGYEKLFFLGDESVSYIEDYGFGFVHGANDAAAKLGKVVEVGYAMVDDTVSNEDLSNYVSSLYEEGTEVVFSPGGRTETIVCEVIEKGEGAGGYIGVKPKSAITTIIFDTEMAVKQMLEAFSNRTFPGGQNLVLDVASGGVRLTFEGEAFGEYDKAAYDAVCEELASGEILIHSPLEYDSPGDILLINVEVTETELFIDIND